MWTVCEPDPRHSCDSAVIKSCCPFDEQQASAWLCDTESGESCAARDSLSNVTPTGAVHRFGQRSEDHLSQDFSGTRSSANPLARVVPFAGRFRRRLDEPPRVGNGLPAVAHVAAGPIKNGRIPGAAR